MRQTQKIRKITILSITVALSALLFVLLSTNDIYSAQFDVTCRVGCHNPVVLFPVNKTKNLNKAEQWKVKHKPGDPAQPMPTPVVCVDCHDAHEEMAILGTFVDPQYPNGVPFRSAHDMDPRALDPQGKTDCEACHDMSVHKTGTVSLKEAAGLGPAIYSFNSGSTDTQSLEEFCISCHSGREGSLFPFNSRPSATPKDINLFGGWTGSKHKTGGLPYGLGQQKTINLTCIGTAEYDWMYPDQNMTTYGCHQSAHASAKQKLLMHAFVLPSPNDGGLNEKEGFCYSCHGNIKGFEVPSLTATGGKKSTHKWDDADGSGIEGYDGGAVSCMACHQVHYQGDAEAEHILWQNRGQPITTLTSDPIKDPAVVPLVLTQKLCFDCHDNDAPVLSGIGDLDTVMSDDLDFSDPTSNANIMHKYLDQAGIYNPVCTVCHTHMQGMVTCSGCHGFPPADEAHYTHVVDYQFGCDNCHMGFKDPTLNPYDPPLNPDGRAGHPSKQWIETGVKNPFLGFAEEYATRADPNHSDHEPVWFPGGTRVNNNNASSFTQGTPGTGNVNCYVGCHNPVIDLSDRTISATAGALTKDNTNVVNWTSDAVQGASLACDRCHDEVAAMFAYGDAGGSKHDINMATNIDNMTGDCTFCHGSIVTPNEKIYLGGGEYFYHTNYRRTENTPIAWPTDRMIPLYYQNDATHFLPVTTNEDVVDTSYSIEDDVTDEAILEGLCLSCHNAIFFDCNLPSSDKLFSTKLLAPNIQRYMLWEQSAHNTGGEVTNFTGLSCLGNPDLQYMNGLVGCHGNPHGSVKQYLLGPSAEPPGANNSLEEEGFCYKCHNDANAQLAANRQLYNVSVGGIMNQNGLCSNLNEPPYNATVSDPGGGTRNVYEYNDIQQAFTQYTEHHNVVDSEQGNTCNGTPYSLECTTCHLVHAASGKWKETPNGKSPISLPSQVVYAKTCESNDDLDLLWGDDPGEKAKDYAAKYTGYGTEKSLFEPGGYCCGGGMKPAEYYMPKRGFAETQSDQTADTVTFCYLECHTKQDKVPCYGIIGPGCDDGTCIPWESDKHGGGLAGYPGNQGEVKGTNGDGCERDANVGHFIRDNANPEMPLATRDKFVGVNFVLMCTDCHDPHGANSSMLIDQNNAIQDNCSTANLSYGGTWIWNSSCNSCHYYYGLNHAGMSCGTASCHIRNSIHEISSAGGSGSSRAIVFDGDPCSFGPGVGTMPEGLILHWDFNTNPASGIGNVAAEQDLSSCTTCGGFVVRDFSGHLTIAPQPGVDTNVLTWGDGVQGANSGLKFDPNSTGQGIAQLDFTNDTDGYPEKYGIITSLQNGSEFTVEAMIRPEPVNCDAVDKAQWNLNAKLRRDIVGPQFWIKNWAMTIMRFEGNGDLNAGDCSDTVAYGPDHDVLRFWLAAGDPYDMEWDWWCGTWPKNIGPSHSNGGAPGTSLSYSGSRAIRTPGDCNVDPGTPRSPVWSWAQTEDLASGAPTYGKALISDGATWQHIVGTWDGQNIRIYIDGCLAAETVMKTGTGGPGTLVAMEDPLFWSGAPLNRHVAAYFAVGGRAAWSTSDNKPYGTIAGTADGIEYYDAYGDYDTESWAAFVGNIDEVKYHNVAQTPTQVTCSGCHPSYPDMSASHQVHFSSTHGPTNQVLDDGYDKACATTTPTGTPTNLCDNCHGYGATYGKHEGHNTAAPGRDVVFKSDGVNGPTDPIKGLLNDTLDGSTAGATDPSVGTRVCDRCHGVDEIVDAQSWRLLVRNNWDKDVDLDWINTLPNGTTDYCGACHGVITTPGYEAGTTSIVNTPFGTGDGTYFGTYRDHITSGIPDDKGRFIDDVGNPGYYVGDAEAKEMMTNYVVGHSGAAINHPCRDCHESASSHINQQPDDTMRMATIIGDAPPNPELEDDACTVMCHDGSGDPGKALGKPVSTHGNSYNPIDRPYIQQEEDFPGAATGEGAEGMEIRCIRCHNVHGTSNLAQIRDTDFETPDGGTRTVVFLSRTGADSFDEPGDATLADETDDLCVTCHIYESPLGSGTFVSYMASHDGGRHIDKNDPEYGYMKRDFTGSDCMRCHSHNNDSLYTSIDGFMPGVDGGSLGHDCLECHTTGGLSQYDVDVQFDGVGTMADNGLLSQHLINYDPTDYTGGATTDRDKFDIECIKCHGENHPTKERRVVGVDMGVTYSSSNFRSRIPDNMTAFCVECHDGVADTGVVTDLQFGNIGNAGVAGTLPVNQLAPRSGGITGPWNPNPVDPDPLTGLPTYQERYANLFLQNGHGATEPLNPVRTEGPKLSCVEIVDPDSGAVTVFGCHSYHGNSNYRLIKTLDGSYDGTMTYNYDGESFNTYDDWCTFTCHARLDPIVNDHTAESLLDAESGDSRDAKLETDPQNPTHPTSMLIPADPFYKNEATVRASVYIGAYLSPTGLPNAGDILCVTCHDPHGSNPEDEVDPQMVRIEWSNPTPLAEDPTEVDLCQQCHQ